MAARGHCAKRYPVLRALVLAALLALVPLALAADADIIQPGIGPAVQGTLADLQARRFTVQLRTG